jgi:5-methylcytosine-specific restriction endonuclease McrA
MAAKKCTKCGEVKPLDQFYKFKLGKLRRQAECKPCSDARRRAFAKTRREAERESRRLWAKNNPDKAKLSKAISRAKPEQRARMRKYSAAWYAENRDRLRPVRAAWYQETYEDRKPLYAQYQANRRALLRGAVGSHSLGEIWALYAKQRGHCATCSESLDGSFDRDHIVPLIAGGDNYITNIQLLCALCNRRKGARSMEEFLKTRSLKKEDEQNGRRRFQYLSMVHDPGE